MMLCAGLFFATTGLFLSWLLNRTLYSIMASYTVIIGGLVMGTLLVTLVLSTMFNDQSLYDHCPLMWINPGMMLSNVLDGGGTQMLSLTYGILCYLMLTALMLWRMIFGFRRFAMD